MWSSYDGQNIARGLKATRIICVVAIIRSGMIFSILFVLAKFSSSDQFFNFVLKKPALVVSVDCVFWGFDLWNFFLSGSENASRARGTPVSPSLSTTRPKNSQLFYAVKPLQRILLTTRVVVLVETFVFEQFRQPKAHRESSLLHFFYKRQCPLEFGYGLSLLLDNSECSQEALLVNTPSKTGLACVTVRMAVIAAMLARITTSIVKAGAFGGLFTLCVP
uniref:Uncharacterized protein n=1 Tax=Cannabis sativa TaxID=3483 RepID=A0A803PZB9_CANSA